jgi:cytochrome c-type biogenesis protein CcmH
MRRALALALAALVLAVPAAAAQCPKTTLADVEDEVMCPVCGTPLGLATEAPQAERERALIERLIAECQSKEQIKDRLVAEFGDEVLSLPDDEGFDLAAWIVPGLVILVAGGVVAVAAVRWRRARDAAADAPRPPGAGTGAADSALNADLDRYDL